MGADWIDDLFTSLQIIIFSNIMYSRINRIRKCELISSFQDCVDESVSFAMNNFCTLSISLHEDRAQNLLSHRVCAVFLPRSL